MNASGVQVIGNTFRFRGTLSNDTAAYADKDALGAKFTLTDCFRSPNNSGFIQDIILTCSVNTEAPDVTLFCFDTAIGTYNNNASFAVSDAEIATCVAFFDIASTDWRATPNNAIAQLKGLGALVRSLDQNLYCQFMIRSATTFGASSSINYLVNIAPD